MSSPTRTVAGRLGRLRRSLVDALGRRSRRVDGGVVVAAQSDDADGADHLRDVSDGAGCTEIWEHLSERREEEDRDGDA